MTAPPVAPTDLTQRLTAAIDRVVWDREGPLLAALRVLGEPEIADGQAALATLRALADLHQPRTWADAITKVCAHCEKAWPCATAELVGPEP